MKFWTHLDNMTSDQICFSQKSLHPTVQAVVSILVVQVVLKLVAAAYSNNK